jgi:phage-related tail fiber protein
MPNLTEALTGETKKSAVIEDCLSLIDAEVADKGGLTGLAIKAGYRTVQGIKPGFVRQVVTDLLPEFAVALQPIFDEAQAKGNTVREHFASNTTRVADALLTITDDKAKRSKSGMVKGTYEKLRGSAKKNVEAAVPRLAAMIEKHAS